MYQEILFTQLFACAAMTGLIWVIQLVHYPAFHFVEKANFSQFEKFHTTKISFIVMPVMVIELLSALALVTFAESTADWWILANMAILVFIWLFTAFVSARYHGLLTKGYDKLIVDNLVRTNWVRTVLWTGRGVLIAVFAL